MQPQTRRRHGGPTQRERVLHALKRAGGRGITRADLLAPTCDGGPPILNFNARVSELAQLGHQIETRGRRHKCVVHVLVGAPESPAPEPAVTAPDAPAPVDDRLFSEPATPPRTASAIFGEVESGRGQR